MGMLTLTWTPNLQTRLQHLYQSNRTRSSAINHTSRPSFAYLLPIADVWRSSWSVITVDGSLLCGLLTKSRGRTISCSAVSTSGGVMASTNYSLSSTTR